jgi:hypothetical protein
MQPKTKVERAMAKEIPWDDLGTLPHCDARVLHLPEECTYCADRVDLQEERVELGVSNTGVTNRAWPCPADKARSSDSLNGWYGNVARKDTDEPHPFTEYVDDALKALNREKD